MIEGVPPQRTELLEADRGQNANRMSRSWYDFMLWVAKKVVDVQAGTFPPGVVPTSSILFTDSNRVLGRTSTGGGPGEEVTFTDQAQQLADDTSFSQMRETLGLDAAVTPYTPGIPASWATVPNDVAEALDYLVALPVFDVNTILTNGSDVLVDANGNVLVSG